MRNKTSTPHKWQFKNLANNNEKNGIYTYRPMNKDQAIQQK